MTAQPEIRDAIIREARSLIGVPFVHQGRDARFGVDCRGMLLVIADRIGYRLSREWRSDYARNPDGAEFREALEAELQSLPSLEYAQPGDVFLIRFPRQTSGEATHVAMLAEGPYESMLIHSYATDAGGQVTEEPRRRWEPYLVAAFTWDPERFVSPLPLGEGQGEGA